jgi:1,2-diacylglycerol-3-alpha-glucose alpha-1,2-galactosyltransferase
MPLFFCRAPGQLHSWSYGFEGRCHDPTLAVAAEFPQLTFVWVGGRPFGPFTEGIYKLNRQIEAAKKNNPRLIFAGTFPQERMPLIYNAADILLFPRFQENSPLVPIEAGAAGLPVIFRDLPEYARLYHHSYLKAENYENAAMLAKVNK